MLNKLRKYFIIIKLIDFSFIIFLVTFIFLQITEKYFMLYDMVLV